MRCRAGGETRARFVFPFIFNLAKIIFIQLHCTFVSFLFDLSLQKVEPGAGVDDPLATDDLLRVLLLELILLTVMAHIAPHLRLPVEMNLPGALHNIIVYFLLIPSTDLQDCAHN